MARRRKARGFAAEPAGPPARLPAGYLPIWQALAEANERAASRQSLARELGISTHTIQRILVAGEVPRFPQESNPRITGSWTRTLTRLAERLGYDAGEWLRAVGLPSGPAGSGVGPNRDRRTGAAAAPRSPVGLPARLTVGLAAPGLFADSHEPGTASFGRSLADLWLGAFDPSGRPEWLEVPGERLLETLHSAAHGVDLGFGIWDVASGAERDLPKIGIPGWRVSLSGVFVTKSDRTAPAWEEAIPRGGTPPYLLVSTPAHPARGYLAGPARVDASRQTSLATIPADPTALFELRAESATAAEPGVAWISDALTCRHWARHWEAAAGDGDRLRIHTFEVPDGNGPAYRLALGLSSELAPLAPALRRVLERELFGSLAGDTARHYADRLTEEIRGAVRRDPFAASIARGPVGIEDFAEAGDRFLSAFADRLLERLSREIIAAVGTGPDRHWAKVLARRQAESILPIRWRPFFEASLEGRGPEAEPHCHSCSTSLLEPHHRGASDLYCRYCSDEHGQLRERDQVRRILTGWFAQWPGAVTEPEAARRAASFMSAMPAWRRN